MNTATFRAFPHIGFQKKGSFASLAHDVQSPWRDRSVAHRPAMGIVDKFNQLFTLGKRSTCSTSLIITSATCHVNSPKISYSK